ncbi:MAG TPA: PA14 domain-containing protein, partial [Chloroflexia bacterium]|nr:PA14 domain-containing protein [Chloroflexia bacterium]
YVAAGLYGQPTIEFLIGGPGGQRFDGLFQTPLPRPSVPGRDALVFLYYRNADAVAWFRALYPHLVLDTPTAPHGGNAILDILRIPAADLEAVYGLHGSLRTTDAPPASRVDAMLDFGPGTPLAQPFTATWTGALTAPANGTYRLRLDVDPPASSDLTLGGVRLAPDGTTPVVLAAGHYPLTVSVATGAPPRRLRLLWTAPGGGEEPIPAARLLSPGVPDAGLTGTYWGGAAEPPDPPAFVRIDPTPSWFHWNEPVTNGTGPFSVSWEGTLLVPQTGDYTFGIQTMGRSELWLDGRQVMTATAALEQQNDVLGNRTVTLAAGPHPVRMVIHALGWRDPVYWYWTPPGGSRAIIPFNAFRPPPPVPAGP